MLVLSSYLFDTFSEKKKNIFKFLNVYVHQPFVNMDLRVVVKLINASPGLKVNQDIFHLTHENVFNFNIC